MQVITINIIVVFANFILGEFNFFSYGNTLTLHKEVRDNGDFMFSGSLATIIQVNFNSEK